MKVCNIEASLSPGTSGVPAAVRMVNNPLVAGKKKISKGFSADCASLSYKFPLSGIRGKKRL
jgi:hypothetical protein